MAKEKEEAEVPHVIVGENPYFGSDNVLHVPGEVVYAKASAAGANLKLASKAEAAEVVEPVPPKPAPVEPSPPIDQAGAQAASFGAGDGPDPDKKV